MNRGYQELENEYDIGVYARRCITLVRGKGALVWDDKGKRYIDCATGIGVASIGHGNKAVASAIAEQAETLITVAGVFYNDIRARCLEKLVAITPGGLNRAFLCNSGAEAIEGAIKFVRQTTNRAEIVSAMRGFHGRTYGALSATHKKDYQEPFAPLVPGFRSVPYNNIEALERTVDESTAAVILELVQGEGGVRPATPEYVAAAQTICQERGAILIVDEIQTGFCRTGKMFACEHHHLQPDILCLAKAMAGGIPMGAILVNDRIQTQKGTHGSTFGGNPLACAAFLAAVEYMEQHKLAERAMRLGEMAAEYLQQQDLTLVREVRHLGLMIGIEIKAKVTPFLDQLQKRGVIALPAGTTVIRLLPPLVIEEHELMEALRVIVDTLRSDTP